METMFLQDKDRIIVSATFKTYRRTVSGSSGDDDEDTLLSIRFEDEQWEIMAQNVEERKAISHLLECVGKNMSAEEASELGKKNGVIGVDKYIMKSGVLVRKAKTAYKKDERFVIIVPGKLLLFLSADLVGKHVRYVTSLIGARVQISRSRMEFEVLVPNTKDLLFSSASSMEGFSSWVKVIEASAHGDTSVYSDDSDGYDDGRRHGNSGGAGWDRPHRSHRGVERRRPRAPDYYEDISEDQRQGPATTDVQKSQYAGDDHRWQPPEDDRNWSQEQGQNSSHPRSRPDDASYGQPRDVNDDNYGESSRAPQDESLSRGRQPYGAGDKTQEYQQSKMQDMQANRLASQQAYNTGEQFGTFDNAVDKGLSAFSRIQARINRIGNNNTGLKEEDNWGQKQFKNVNMRRRSVPLQCLDSALDEMTTSIGNMAPFQGVQPSGYSNSVTETANNYNLHSSKPNMAEALALNDYNTQSSAGFSTRSPVAGAARLEPLVENPQDYNDQSSHVMAAPKQMQLQENNSSSPYTNQSSYSTCAKQMQSKGNDSSSYINQSSYVAGPKQMQSQGNDPSSSYISQSGYTSSPKQMQSQGNDPSSPYANQSGYTTSVKQMQWQGSNPSSSSSYANQSGYSAGLKQMQSQGNNLSNSASVSMSQYDPNMKSYDYRTDPLHHNTNTAIETNKSDAVGYNSALSQVQQSVALEKSTIAAGAIDWGGGRLIVQIDAHKKPPITRSDTKAYGAIMGGASSAPPQFSPNARMAMVGNSKPQSPSLQDPGTRPFQG